MVETLAQAVHSNYSQRRTIIALFVGVVALLLLWRHAVASNTVNNITEQKLGDVGVSPQYINYLVPGLDIPNVNDPSLWDWMQSTDCACNCDELNWQNPTQVVLSYPVYSYIASPGYPTSPITFNFPTYVAPPLGQWWYEWGYNVHHEQAEFVYTSDGVNGILGKYSRSAWNDPEGRQYPDQSQTKNVSIQGDDAYINGKHYKHNVRKDKSRPYDLSQFSVMFT